MLKGPYPHQVRLTHLPTVLHGAANIARQATGQDHRTRQGQYPCPSMSMLLLGQRHTYHVSQCRCIAGNVWLGGYMHVLLSCWPCPCSSETYMGQTQRTLALWGCKNAVRLAETKKLMA